MNAASITIFVIAIAMVAALAWSVWQRERGRR